MALANILAVNPNDHRLLGDYVEISGVVFLVQSTSDIQVGIVVVAVVVVVVAVVVVVVLGLVFVLDDGGEDDEEDGDDVVVLLLSFVFSIATIAPIDTQQYSHPQKKKKKQSQHQTVWKNWFQCYPKKLSPIAIEQCYPCFCFPSSQRCLPSFSSTRA